jgi:hypothetical protein
MDSILSKNRLMSMMKPEPGALVLALGQHLHVSIFPSDKGQ